MNKASTMRVVSGELRGRRLAYPGGGALRPTMGQTREAVFSALGDRSRDAVFADLYSGPGSMGIEALSRGAAFVHFVEWDAETLRFLRANLAHCGIAAARYRIHEGEAGALLARGVLAEPGASIVFADPPYEGGEAERVLAHFQGTRYARLELLMIEHRGELPEIPGLLSVEKVRRYGGTSVTFFANSGGRG